WGVASGGGGARGGAGVSRPGLGGLLSAGGPAPRPRRGFGIIRPAAATGEPLPHGWTLRDIQPPDLPDWPTVLQTGLSTTVSDRLASALSTLLTRSALTEATEVGDYPQLNATNWHGVLLPDRGASWTGVLATAGQRWRHFRATEDAPDAKYDPQLKTWEWLNTIQGPNSRLFPLGALGLPIVFKKGIEVAPRVDG